MVKDYYDVRAVFKKTDRAIYISHLDLMRVMQRTFKRAKLPVWFSKGYNPHVYLMFLLPLSLGVSSECEMMDFGIDMSSGEPDYELIKNRLNETLPNGLEIVSVYHPENSHTKIGASEYECKYIFESEGFGLKDRFNEFMSQENIFIDKRCKVNMKKTIVKKDIKPDITVLEAFEEGNTLTVKYRLPSGISTSLNVVSVNEAFEKFCGVEFEKICAKRTKILDLSGKDFA